MNINKKMGIHKDIEVLVNDYNEKAKILTNGDIIFKDRKVKGKFKNKNDAMIYMLRLGWFYAK
jgi:hypothetical protein